MMNYDIFKEVVAEKILDYLPEEYKNRKVEIHSVDKVNQTKDGLNLLSEGMEMGISPTIYVNDMYEHYKVSGDLNDVLKTAAENMEKAMQESPVSKESLDFENAKDNIVFQLINTEQNKEMLKSTPNRAFQDLSIIYRWIVKVDEQGI